MLNLEVCQKILNKGGYKNIDNTEIGQLRDMLYKIARLQIEIENKNNGGIKQ